MGDKKSAFPLLAAVAAYVIWGFSFMFTRVALRSSTPSVLLSMRYLAAFATINLLLLTGRFRLSLRGKPLLPLLLLGFLQPLAYFFLESYGILYTGSVFSGVMIALIPIATLALSAVVLKEKPTLRQTLFSLLSIAGVLVLAAQGGSEGAARPLGVACLVGAVLTAACFTVLNRRVSATYTAFERTYIIMLFGAVGFTAVAAAGNLSDLGALVRPFADKGFLAAVLYLGPISSVAAFAATNYAIGRLPATRVSVMANLTTLVSVFAGAVFLKEPFTLLSGVCCAVILAGIWGVQRSAPKELEAKHGE